MKKRDVKKKASPPGRKKRVIHISVTDEEYARFEAKAATTRHGVDVTEFAKSVVLNASGGKEKVVGEPGNRNQPSESAPTARYKSAAPPRRGRLSNTSEDQAQADSKGSPVAVATKQQGYKSHPDSPVEYVSEELAETIRKWREKSPESTDFLERILRRQRDYRIAHPNVTQQEMLRQMPRFLFDETMGGIPDNDLYLSLIWESDRGCVLVAAAMIDESLEALLTAFFKSRSTLTKSDLNFFFENRPTPPLQSTALKIRVAFVCGLIDRDLSNALLALQSLRSKTAAHSRVEMKLTSEAVERIVKWIGPAFREHLLPNDDVITVRRACTAFGMYTEGISNAKFEFALAASLLDWMLEQETTKLTALESQSTDGSSK